MKIARIVLVLLVPASGCAEDVPPQAPGMGDPVTSPDGDGECRTSSRASEGQFQRFFRWDDGQRQMRLEMTAATTRGPLPSVFVYQLDANDRLLSQEQQVDGAAQWRHVFTRDDRGNPLTFAYEFGGQVSSRATYINTYDGDRLRTTETLTEGGSSAPSGRSFTHYEYDDRGRRVRVTYEADAGTPGQRRETRYNFDSQDRLASVEQDWLRDDRSLTKLEYDAAGRLIGRTIDGGPYLGAHDGRPEHRTTWTYDDQGRLTRWDSRGHLSDVGAPDDRASESFSPGCQRFQTRFPGLFGQPAELRFH